MVLKMLPPVSIRLRGRGGSWEGKGRGEGRGGKGTGRKGRRGEGSGREERKVVEGRLQACTTGFGFNVFFFFLVCIKCTK